MALGSFPSCLHGQSTRGTARATTNAASTVEWPVSTPVYSLETISQVGSQIRSRITVVCAECKRLKLKCDRKNPCGSCTKRDTIAKCIYSPAAAEKVDLHSLNNRLVHVESTLSQLIPSFHPTYPAVQPQPQPTTSTNDNESDIRLSFVDSPQPIQPSIAPPPPTGISSLSIPISDLNNSFLHHFGLAITLARLEPVRTIQLSLFPTLMPSRSRALNHFTSTSHL